MDKSEIKRLPEGVSSAELDELTTDETVEPDAKIGTGNTEKSEAELAQEALDATEEPSPAEESVEDEPKVEEEEPVAEKESEKEKPEADPKDAVIGDFRRKLRDSELEAATLKGKLEAQTEKAKDEEPPKSPLEIAEAAYIQADIDAGGEGSLDGFAMTGDLYRKQRAFDDAQAESKTTTEKQKQVNVALTQAAESLQEGDLSVEKAGKGLDLKTIADMGDPLLTRGDEVDLLDIQASRGHTAAVKAAYKIMLRRILSAGGEDAKALKVAINAKSKSQTKPKQPKQKTDIDALTTEGEEEPGEAETDTHSKRLVDFIFSE